MSFWRFKFASVGNSIDSLLNALPLLPSNPPTPSEIALFDSTLDSLLATPDLLSEIKSGTNQKLRDFLARKHVIERLGGWIVWGLGGEEEEEPELTEGSGGVGIIGDDVEDGKVPDGMVGVGIGMKKKLKMGRVVRRRDMDLMGVLDGGEEETEEEKLVIGHPRLCTEILSSDAPGLTDILYNHAAASSQPETCPSPSTFLLPFWETLLKSTEVQLETRGIQVGYWARVISVLLNGPKSVEVLAQIFEIPHLLPRLLTLLPICSPINDILLLLLRVSKLPSPLTISLVPQTLRMLDPLAILGKAGHVAAEELLRGVIELCSVAAPPLPPPLSNGNGDVPPSHIVEGGLEWRENGLARQIAAERSIQMLVDWILVGTEKVVKPIASRLEVDLDETPRISILELPIPTLYPSNDLRTSTLIQSIPVLIDLIQKNNSDFVEQQMLTWARRKETEEREKELEEEVIDQAEGIEVEEKDSVDLDKGPSLVDLGPLLKIVAERLGGFQELIKSPRSFSGSIETTVGIITPLTLERFRICEFYAELLHCSNMSLVNRSLAFSHLYDTSGFLAQGWRAADDLSDALAGLEYGEEEGDSRILSSPGQQPSISIYDASCPVSPVEIPLSYSPGLSSPSGHGSLDSESGILTRAEVKALDELVAGSERDDADDVDPFGDPIDHEGLVEAIEDLNLEGEEIISKGVNITSSHGTDYLPPGSLLKKMFMEHHIIETVLDLFFDFPWNNFLHNVVFDIVQQIFHGRIDRPLDRQLVLSVFLDGRVIDRILDGQRVNDIACARTNGTRLGYMGHMSLIAEEIVKLFHHYPVEIYSVVEPHIPQPGWDQYVTTTLKETRERDSAPLGGGISMIAHDTASTTSGLSDEDDEFPVNGGRALKAVEAGNQAGGGTGIDEGASGGYGKDRMSTDIGEPGTSDKFSRYLANAISSDRPDRFGSSDEDDSEEDAGWLGGSRFDPGDVDFELSESTDAGPTKFGFEDRFESAGSQIFRSTSPDSDDDADWGPFATDSPDKKIHTFSTDDEFKPTVASTSVIFESTFSSFGSDDFASASSFPQFSHATESSCDDDDFGDFEGGQESTTTVNLPSGEEALSDFDFGEESRVTPTASSFSSLKRPSFERTITADDGSNLFGGLSDPEESDCVADRATSLEEPLGPLIHEGAHLTSDGMVEAVIDGNVVVVPADDIALAHSRNN